MDFVSYLDDVIKEYKNTNSNSNIIKLYEVDYIKPIYAIVLDNCKHFMTEEEIKVEFNKNIQNVLKHNDFIRCEPWYISIINVDPSIIEYLSNIKQPEQKTTEWYLFRHDHITASNAWKALASQANKNQLIYEKCVPINTEKYKPTLNENSLTWGHKYEPLSTEIYELKTNVKVKEFGCIEHSLYTFLAASPDGIVISENNYGRMLEIKNVVSRVIDGIPKKEYYVQMQLQMEVCNLDECDFVETKFIEYEGYQEFMDDTNFEQKGIILSFIIDNKFVYKYMPFNINYKSNVDEIDKWINETKEKTEGEWFKNIYWKLDVYSCVLVKRNKEWFSQAIIPLTELWTTIVKERQTGDFDKRCPKKKKFV
jgi:putative phage-type endonuclease